MKIAVIVVNYKQIDLTIECIKSVKKSSYKDYEMIIVDNASEDGSIEKLRVLEDIIVLEAKVNEGFSAGNNIGIRYALKHGADAVLLLNNDTVVEERMIEKLVKGYNDNEVRIPQMLYYDQPNIVWYAGGHIDYIKAKGIHEGIGKKENRCDKERSVDFVTGCCILIPKKVIECVGELSERFFMYCEDFEYSLRLSKYKITMRYIPEAVLWHKVGASTNKKSAINVYYDTRNRLIVMKEYQFGKLSFLYVYVTRMIRYVEGMIKNSNYIYVKQAICDYKNNLEGKVELK